MPPFVARRICSPPDLPPYLKNIHELKPIDGIPSDQEFMGIHALIRMASRVVDVPDMGDPNTTYTPPVLPVHVPVQLEPVIGAPSEEEIIKVQSAIRQNDVPNEASVKKPEQSIAQVEENAHTNNIGSGANVIELNRSTHVVHDSGFRVEDVIERSNQLVEQTNQLVERSNQLIERSNQITQVSNQLLERYSQATEWPDKTPEKHNEVLERLNGHLEKANQVAVESTKPTERLGDILETINKVLVGIQHAIVRNGKGNSRFALDSLINEKGDTLCKNTGGAWSFRNLFRHAGHNEPSIPIFVNGVMEEFSLPERILGSVLCYHGLGGDLCETGSEVKLKPGTADMARARLSRAANMGNRPVAYSTCQIRTSIPIMTDRPGWYPPGQICHPPELPVYLKNVYDLKPIVGVPNDAEVTRIHAVLHAARKLSEVPAMMDPSLLMGLADHLFDVQMGIEANIRLSPFLVATYSPPNLPDHLSTKLESVSGAPTNEQMIKVQDILLNYQEMRRFPSMFDAHVNMELSQHLFDLQMARHMRMAGESEPILGSDATLKPPVTLLNTPHTPSKTEEAITTNNIGRGADDIEAHYTIHSVTGAETRDLIERSNKLAERFNQLLERSNELLEGRNKSTDSSSTPNSVQQFNQMLERLTQIVEHSQKPAEQFNQLFDRLNQLVELSKQPAQRANELGEQSNNIADRANQLIEQLNQSFGHSNQLSEKANKSLESFAGLLQNINGVLVGIQHAIVRSHKGNTISAINCLVNDKGQKPGVMHQKYRTTVEALSNSSEYDNIPVAIDGVSQVINLPSHWLGDFLRFYSLGDNLHIHPGSTTLKQGKTREAQNRLGDYLSSCLG
ncbi:hypothetical protein RHS03_01229, partial [Rhizoctonia solani]